MCHGPSYALHIAGAVDLGGSYVRADSAIASVLDLRTTTVHVLL